MMIGCYDPNLSAMELIEDIRSAARQFWNEKDISVLFDKIQLNAAKRDFLNRIVKGENITKQEVDNTLYQFINAWHSRASKKDSQSLTDKLINCSQSLQTIDNDVSLLGVNCIDDVRKVFDEILQVNRISATAASKILALILPGKFVMWDGNIANSYGFSANSCGYVNFLRIMRKVYSKLLIFWGNRTPSLEVYLSGGARQWQPTVAKLLDEWNWVRITAKVPYKDTARCSPV